MNNKILRNQTNKNEKRLTYSSVIKLNSNLNNTDINLKSSINRNNYNNDGRSKIEKNIQIHKLTQKDINNLNNTMRNKTNIKIKKLNNDANNYNSKFNNSSIEQLNRYNSKKSKLLYNNAIVINDNLNSNKNNLSTSLNNNDNQRMKINMNINNLENNNYNLYPNNANYIQNNTLIPNNMGNYNKIQNVEVQNNINPINSFNNMYNINNIYNMNNVYNNNYYITQVPTNQIQNNMMFQKNQNNFMEMGIQGTEIGNYQNLQMTEGLLRINDKMSPSSITNQNNNFMIF